MFAIAALVLFILAALNTHLGELNVAALGLAALTCHFVVGPWPLGSIQITRRN